MASKHTSVFLSLALSLLIVISLFPVFAEKSYDEKLATGDHIEEMLAHIWMIQKKLDENNKGAALVHLLHAKDLHLIMEPELRKQDVELVNLLEQDWVDLQKGISKGASPEEVQPSIDRIKKLLERVRTILIGDDLSSNVNFKSELAIHLLETSVVEYYESVSDGKITDQREYEDGLAFVHRSEQIYESIKDQIPHERVENIDKFYAVLYKASETPTEPLIFKVLAEKIILEMVKIQGIEREVTDLTDYVENIRTLLTFAKEEYAAEKNDEALSLVLKAYLYNYEFLEPTMEELNPELNEEIEILLRHELRFLINEDVPTSLVSAKIDQILLKMDEVAVIVPEFGSLAMMILALAVITGVFIGSRSPKLSLTPKI